MKACLTLGYPKMCKELTTMPKRIEFTHKSTFMFLGTFMHLKLTTDCKGTNYRIFDFVTTSIY